MKLPRLLAEDKELLSSEHSLLQKKIAKALAASSFKDESIAVFADLSISGVLLSIASIKLGLKVAFCSVREPYAVTEQWLKELGIKTLVSTVKDALNFINIPQQFFFDDLINTKSHLDLPNNDANFVSITRTSGTKAKPKSAIIKGSAHQKSAEAVNSYFDFDESSTWLLSIPLNHVGGLAILFRALNSLGSVYVASNHKELVSGIISKQISHCSLVPAQVHRLLAEEVDLSSLKAVIVGGDRLAPFLREQALSRFWPLYECYGMTETASMIAVSRSQNPKLEILPHAEVILANDGEILVRGNSLFSGYYEEEKIILPFTSEGYFKTGDIYDAQKFDQLNIIYRKNNRIISGGENIQAEEIESVLEEHPAISDAAVIGVPDERWGERPVAYIKWQKEPALVLDINRYLRTKLASFKCPDMLLSWPTELLSSLKKPRQQLLDHYYRFHQT